MSQPENTANAAPVPSGLSVGMALACLSLLMLLASMNTSVANVALPSLALAFDASFQQVQWIVLSYLLAMTTLVVSVGRLSDMIGRRRLLLWGLFVFILASAICGVAPDLWLLILARFAQGVGAATLMALPIAFVGETVPKARTGRAMGLLGSMSAVGTALGPSLGGFLIADFGWQAIFLINLPLGALTFFFAYRYLPQGRSVTRNALARFDNLGTILLALTLAAYALAVTLGRGNFGALNLALLVAAAFGVGVFLLAERSAPSPLVPLYAFRNPVLAAGFGTSGLVATVMMATLVVGPFYLSQALLLDARSVGIAMSVGPVLAALSSVPAGRLADRFGADRTTMIGLAGIGTGSIILFLLPADTGVVGYVGPIVIMTTSYALFQTSNNTAVMRDVAQDQRGVISGLLNLSRNLGLITGAAVMGAVFAFASGTVAVGAASPDGVAAGMRATFATGAGLIGLALAFVATVQLRTPKKVTEQA